MRNFSLFFLLLVLLPGAVLCRDKTYTIQSPDCSLTVTIGCGDRIVYSVRSDTNQILKPSPLAVRLVSGECWGERSRVAGVRRYRIDAVHDAPIYKKRKVEDRCNGIEIDFREGFSLEFRAYDDAVAYRFVARQSGEVLVAGEEARSGSPRGPSHSCPMCATPLTDTMAWLSASSSCNRSRIPIPGRRYAKWTPPAWRSCRCSYRRPGE